MPRFFPSTPAAPYRFPVRHIRGNDLLMLITARNEDGSPYDFTGHMFRMQVRRHADADAVEVDIPHDSFTIQADDEGTAAGVNNQAAIQHTKADFLGLLPIEYTYDIEVTDAAGLVFTPQYGPFAVVADVTR